MNLTSGKHDSKDEQNFLNINIESHICRKVLCADCFQQNQDETSRSQAIKLKQFLEKSNLILSQSNDKKQIEITFKDLKEKVNEIESIYKKLAEKFVKNMTIFNKNLKESNIGLEIIKEKLSEDKIKSLSKIELEILDHASLCAQIVTKLSHLVLAANQVQALHEQFKEFSVNCDINVEQGNLVIQTSYVRNIFKDLKKK